MHGVCRLCVCACMCIVVFCIVTSLRVIISIITSTALVSHLLCNNVVPWPTLSIIFHCLIIITLIYFGYLCHVCTAYVHILYFIKMCSWLIFMTFWEQIHFDLRTAFYILEFVTKVVSLSKARLQKSKLWTAGRMSYWQSQVRGKRLQ